MSQVCSKCSHVNPSEASYCYYDGAVLGGHSVNGGPVNAGSAPFPGPFVFPTGQACRNFDQLAMACQQHWTVAVDLLKQGFLASFLGGLGRIDLAMAAQEAARFPDQDRGLDQLLAKLPTEVLQKPKLLAEPSEINLGTIPVGTDRQFELHLRNQGMRLLYGSAVSDCKWLTLGEAPGNSQKLFQFGSDGTVLVQVRGQHLRAGNKPLEGHLVVESNGGEPVTITVRVEVPARPFREGVLAGAISPRQIAEKAKGAPKDAAPLFEHGVVAAWFKENGWTYPVQGPNAAGLGAVQQFFEALGLATAPKVEVTEKSLSLRGDIGTAVQATVEVKTQEKRPVYAHATADQSWLDVSKTVLSGRVATIVVAIANVPNRPGEILQAKINVTANGNQRFTVPVSLQVTGSSSYPIQPVVQPVHPVYASEPVMAVQVMPVQAVLMPYPTAEPVMAVPVHVEANPFALPPPVQAYPVSHGGVTAAPPGPPPLLNVPIAPRAPGREGRTSPWVHLAPAGVLLLALIIVILRDLITGGSAGAGEVDPKPRIKAFFEDGSKDEEGRKTGTAMRFGVTTVNLKDPKEPGNKLLFDSHGRTNNTMVLIDPAGPPGAEKMGPVFGKEGGKWAEDAQGKSLRAVPAGKWGGTKSVWIFDQGVEVTQIVEIIPGEPQETADFRRLLDTCLVRYQIENRDTKVHKVGLRILLDTCIGFKDGEPNDGVPFMVPGLAQMVDTFRDFPSQDTPKVPDFIQVLENADLKNPGLIAFLNLRVGGLIEPPSRVSLTHWPGHNPAWEIPVRPMGKDSAVALYWNERDMQPKEKRELGFTYGLGNVSAGSSRLGLSVGGDFSPNGELTVVALVSDPDKDRELTLELPKGLTLVEGQAKKQSVPPLGPGGRPTPITWRVLSSQVGVFYLEVRSSASDGLKQKKRVNIKTQAIF